MRLFIIIITKIMQKKQINVILSMDQVPIYYAHFQKRLIKILIKLWKHSNIILKKGFQMANYAIEVALFIILILQTVHVLSNRTSNSINVRHLLVKWIAFICILSISKYIKGHTQLDQLFIFMCNSIAFLIVYPSKFIRELHIKYFAYKQRTFDGDSLRDLAAQKASIPEKLIASLAWILLKILKFMIVFVPLTQRRYIEEQLREINTLIVEEKSFWKIYQTQKASSQFGKSSTHLEQIQMFKGGSIVLANSHKNNNSVIQQGQSPLLLKPQSQSFHQLKKSDFVNSSYITNPQIIRAKAQQHIQMSLPTFYNQEGYNKKYVFYRNVDIEYKPLSAVLKISSDQDGKTDSYKLVEIVLIDDYIIQFQCQNQADLISIKFKSKEEKSEFITSVNSSL